MENPPFESPTDPLDREVPELMEIVPTI